jgi:ribose/xylose/arabinose/galactoside ABC-type transport system permease subunit
MSRPWSRALSRMVKVRFVAAETLAAAGPRATRVPSRVREERLQNVSLLVLLLVVAGATSVLKPAFIGADNLLNVANDAALLGIVAFGMSFVIAIAGLDLSVGAVQAGAAILAAQVANSSGTLSAVAVGIAFGVLTGLVNGLITIWWAVPSFIATLGMSSVIRGAGLLHVNGGSVIVGSTGFSNLASGRLLGVPSSVFVALLVFLALLLVLKVTAFGRHVIAVGGNAAAARASGVAVNRTAVAVYVICGGLAGLAGVLLASQLGTVDGSLGQGLELQVIAVTVLGGASLSGGKANLTGTLVAAVLVSAISAALNLLNVPSFYQYLTTGVLLILALAFDFLRRRGSTDLRSTS